MKFGWGDFVWFLFGFFLVTGNLSTLETDTGQDLFQYGVYGNAVLIPSSQFCCGEIKFINFIEEGLKNCTFN